MEKRFILDETLEKEIALKARFIYDTRDRAILDIKRDDMYELFKNIECL